MWTSLVCDAQPIVLSADRRRMSEESFKANTSRVRIRFGRHLLATKPSDFYTFPLLLTRFRTSRPAAMIGFIEFSLGLGHRIPRIVVPSV